MIDLRNFLLLLGSQKLFLSTLLSQFERFEHEHPVKMNSWLNNHELLDILATSNILEFICSRCEPSFSGLWEFPLPH